jgi:hypothetical protein
VLFNPASDAQVHENIEAFAKIYTGDLIFTEITRKNEHYNRFADYIKVNVDNTRFIIIEGQKQQKYLASATQTLEDFVAAYEEKSLTGHKLTDAVT